MRSARTHRPPCANPRRRPPRAPAPLAHADAHRGTPRRDAGLQTSRSRRQSARKMSQIPQLGPPAPTKGFERLESAWRDDKETVRKGLTGCTRDKPCASSGSRLPASRLNDRGLAGRDRRVLQKTQRQRRAQRQHAHCRKEVQRRKLGRTKGIGDDDAQRDRTRGVLEEPQQHKRILFPRRRIHKGQNTMAQWI